MGYDTQTLLPFAARGKQKLAASNGQSAKPKPVKVRFRRTGKIAIRVNGHWIEDVELDPRLYLSLPAATRQAVMKRIVKEEFKNGRPLIAGSSVLVTQPSQSGGMGGSF
jgi:hypothetical protein